MKFHKFIYFLFFCSFVFNTYRVAEAKKNPDNIANFLSLDKKGNGKKEPVFISAKEAVFDNKKFIAIYTKDVEVKKGEMILTAQKVKSFLNKGSKGIIKIEAIGNVCLIKGDIKITSGRATYFENKKMVKLIDSPRIIQGDNVLEGEEISFFMAQDRVEISGSVKTVFLPTPPKIRNKEKIVKNDKTELPINENLN